MKIRHLRILLSILLVTLAVTSLFTLSIISQTVSATPGQWETLTNAPASWGANNGHRIEAMGNYIYFWAGNSTYFARYNPSTLSWETLTAAPITGSYAVGMVAAKDPAGHPAIYIMGGTTSANSQKWYRYTEYNNGWSGSLSTSIPWTGSGASPSANNKPANGTEFVWDGGDIIYFFPGSGYDYNRYDWYKYTISTNTWTYIGEFGTSGDPKNGPGNSACLVTIGSEKYIYIQFGHTPTGKYESAKFMRYQISTGSWWTPAQTGYGADDGADLVWGGGDNLYVFPGAYEEASSGSIDEYRFLVYSISQNQWVALLDFPSPGGQGNGSDDGGAAGIVGDYIYKLKGNDGNGSTASTLFYRYQMPPTGSTPPRVTTSAATSVGTTTATLNGNVTSDGGAAITERGFYCDTSSSPATKYTVSGTTGTYTKDMTGLSSGTKYYFQAFATNSVGTSYGSILDFTTQVTLTMATNAGTTTPSVGAHVYNYGTVVNISATAPVPGPGEQYVWNGWTGTGTGSYTGLNNPANNAVTMSSAITETASWIYQFCGVEINVVPPSQEGYPSQVLTYTIDVHNSGNIVDNFNLSYIPDGWPDITIVPLVLIDVMPSEHMQATMLVHVPDNASPCTYKEITVVAESQFCGATDNDTAQAHVIVRGPILIVGNDNFIPEKGVNGGGSGTELDPYIIENWIISAENAHGIEIRNTTAYFVVRNCVIENGDIGWPTPSYYGIKLQNVANGRIENNISENNNYGIVLYANSRNNVVNNNTFENCTWYGVRLEMSHNNLISNNFFDITKENTTSATWAIGLWEADNNDLENNTVENIRGIHLYNVENIKMRNNTHSSILEGFGIEEDNGNLSHFIHDIDNSNLLNGKPILYLVGHSNEVIGPSQEIGYLGLVNCDNILVENLVFARRENNRNLTGILMANTQNSRVENCAFENSHYGIYITCGSNNNILTHNSVGNTAYGIQILFSSNNNIIRNNDITLNYRGIYIPNSNDNNRIYHNNIINNTLYQAYDNGSNYWDNGYPSGGNYWSDYTGVDFYSGENQDIPGSDGIGDNRYNISGKATPNQDRYPLLPSVCGVDVVIENSLLEGYPSQVLEYTIDVHNSGNVVDNFNLSVIPDGWPDMSIVPPVLIDVQPSEHRQATMFVHVPDGALPCTYKEITVVAESQFCGATDNDTAQAHVIETPGTVEELHLIAGWNLVCFPVDNGPTTPSGIFTGLTYYTDYYIYAWTAPNGPYVLVGADDVLQDNRGYGVYITSDQTITWGGTQPTSRDVYLVTGWNMTGFPVVNENTTPDNIFAPLNYYTDYYLYIWTAPSGPYVPVGPTDLLLDNTGYWVYTNMDMMVQYHKRQ